MEVKSTMQKVVNILLIEDDVLDQIEIRRTLDKKNILYRLKIARNGDHAIALLYEDSDEIFSGKPDIILLDLSMPKMNGFEFLSIIKANENWKDIKIFILTTSDDPKDKKTASHFGISGYITKPLKLDNPSSIDAFNLMIDLMNMQTYWSNGY
jgi:CheY-like chemotaxis protein